MRKCEYDGEWCHYCLHGCEYFPHTQRKSYNRPPMMTERNYRLIYGTGRKMACFMRSLGARYRRIAHEPRNPPRSTAKDA